MEWGSPAISERINAPSGTTLSTYQQSLAYDSLDRLTTGPAGSTGYSDPNHAHAAVSVSTILNPYASYDAMGNLTCRNVDTTSGHTCAGSSPTGAVMTYDNEGRLATWTAPSGTTATDSFLYDNEGNRVLQRVSTSSVTDTITFDGYTETVLSGGTTTTTKYYSADGQRLAMKTNGTLSYLLSDTLGSVNIALSSAGATQAVQLFAPYGSVRYSQGSMPTTYNFTGQRLDGQTGLLYDNFRYYDPLSGRFVRADTTQTNAGGMDPYAYAGENPETVTDPTGQYYIGGSPYYRGYLEPDANGDGGYYLLVYVPSNAAAPSLDDEWVTYMHFNRQWEIDAVGGWPSNGRPVIQCLFGCNSISGLLAGAVVLNPEAEAACVAAPEACAAAVLILIGAVLLIEALKHLAPQTQGPTISQARSHQNDLPIAGQATGPYIYVPPKSARGNPANAWDKAQYGFKDAHGNVWVWAPAGAQHGGPHWDVEHPDGTHTNVDPNGNVIGSP